MYYPYFRGKQFELLTIRDMADVLAQKEFVPIIEPVKESLGGLNKALRAVCDKNGRAIAIVNPYHGAHRADASVVSDLLKDGYLDNPSISAGILLREDMKVGEAIACYDRHKTHRPVFIHHGFVYPKDLAAEIAGGMPQMTNIFVEDQDKILYRKHFERGKRILVKDGFTSRRNADYPEVEEFSDLHVTFRDRGMDGFGDFLTVGDVYREGGGPAYAVAIHITFIDPERDNVMYIYHFVSDDQTTPTDPAGKFAQALRKLIQKLDSGTSRILETSAIKEFRDLHAKGHFPGLGYVKKLSMKHHIETLAHYFD
jgi:hypothetical protein